MRPGPVLLAATAVLAAGVLLCLAAGAAGCRAATMLGDEKFYYLAGVLVYILLSAERGLVLVSSLAAASAAATLLKTVLKLPRPPEAEWLAPAQGPGFPSGHTTVATAFWLGLGLGESIMAATAGLAVALLIGYTRIALRVHYPRDVAGGLLVGAAAAIAAEALARRKGPVKAALALAPAATAMALAAAAAMPGYTPPWRIAGIGAGLLAAALLASRRGCAPPPGPARGPEAVRALAVSTAGAALAAGSEALLGKGPGSIPGFAVFTYLVVASRCPRLLPGGLGG